MKKFMFIRERQEDSGNEKETYVNLFEVINIKLKTSEDILKAMRAAVDDFLKTPTGKKAMKDSSNDFNWGDAILNVPDLTWNKHGLNLLEEDFTITVDQDEVLGKL